MWGGGGGGGWWEGVSSKESDILVSVGSQHCECPAPLTLLSLSASEINMDFILDIKAEGLGKCDENM